MDALVFRLRTSHLVIVGLVGAVTLVGLTTTFGFAHALTQVSGTITTDTQWTLAGSPYVINSGVFVTNGATLTIDPGVVVKIALGGQLQVSGGGALVAHGTQAQPIYVTSLRDDSVAGDTNNDDGTTVPGFTDWSFGTAGSISLDYVTMSYGTAELGISGGSVEVSNSTLTQSIFNIQQTGGVLIVQDSILQNGIFEELEFHGGTATLRRTKIIGGGFVANIRQFGGSLTLDAVDFVAGKVRVDGQATTTIITGSRVGTINAFNGTIVDARNNWWGQSTGPTGTQISGNVLTIPYLTSDPALGLAAASLAKQLVNQNYLYGGKGWDVPSRLFVNTDTVKSGYSYWTDTGSVAFGNGVDCSGLVAWAYNRSVDPSKFFNHNYIGEPSADQQYKYNMQSTTTSDVGLLPGDLLFFDWGKYHTNTHSWDHIKDGVIDHVAVYVGNQGMYDTVQALNPIVGILTTTVSNSQVNPGFVAFGHPKNFSIAVAITKHSPIHLFVTDPDGNTISDSTGIATDEEFIRQSGDLTYATMGVDANGFPEDIVYSPVLKQGVYKIEVAPMSGSDPSQTYSLDFTAGSTTIVLAQDVLISQIPSQGYGVIVSATGIPSTSITTIVDIKPGSYPNTINLGSSGVVPVAILGSAIFDVHQIDPKTVKLAGAPVKFTANGKAIVSYSDVNSDGLTDIVVQIHTPFLQLTSSDVKADLVGQLTNGVAFNGTDSVRIVPNNSQ